MIYNADETLRRPLPADPMTKPGGDDSGPGSPKVTKPDTKKLLERMKRVDPEQAKNYRQRSGQ